MDQSFSEPGNVAYIYRDDGSGRLDGSFLKKYTEEFSRETLAADVGPGLYLVLQKIDGDIQKKRVFIPQNEAPAEPPGRSPKGTGNIAALREILETKMIADQLNPAPNPVEMFTRFLEIMRGGKNVAPGDTLEAYIRGQETGDAPGPGLEEITPETLLTAAGLKLMDKGTEPGPAPAPDARIYRNIVSAVNQRFATLEKRLGAIEGPGEGGKMRRLHELVQMIDTICQVDSRDEEMLRAHMEKLDEHSGGFFVVGLRRMDRSTIDNLVEISLEQNGAVERAPAIKTVLDSILRTGDPADTEKKGPPPVS